MPFPITCSAVGDIIALVQLAITIVEFIGECKGAPQDCLELCQELRSLERLLAVAQSIIAEIRNEKHREIVTERLRIVGRHVAEGLDLVAEFDTAFTASDSRNGRKSRFVFLCKKTGQRVMWKLKRKVNAEACRVIIARCLEPLIVALLLSMYGEESALRQVLESTQTQMHVDLGRIHALVTTSEAKLLSALSIANSEVVEEMRSVNDNLVQFRLDFKNFRTDFNTQQTLSPDEDTRRGHVTLMSISDDVRIVRALIEGTSTTLTPAPTRDGSVVRIHNDSEHIQINISLPALRAIGSALLCAVMRGMTPANGMAITMVTALASRDTQSRYFFSFLTGMLWLIHQHWLVARFSQPDVPHVIFIVDFFDNRHLIPFEKVSSSSNLHNALLELFRGRMGESLLLARNYELVRAPTGGTGASQELLSSSWDTSPCHPGEEVRMNALMVIRMQRQNRHTRTRCPACDTEIVSTCADKDGWVRCVRCPSRFEVRDVQENPARSRMAPNSSFETTTSNSANSDTSLEGGFDVETERREHDNWQQYIRRVSAAEVQTQELQRLKRIRVLQILLGSDHTLGIHLDELDPSGWSRVPQLHIHARECCVLRQVPLSCDWQVGMAMQLRSGGNIAGSRLRSARPAFASELSALASAGFQQI